MCALLRKGHPSLAQVTSCHPRRYLGDGEDGKPGIVTLKYVPDRSEDPLIAARLFEETGYEAHDWTKVAEGPSSAGLTDEMITMYFATGAHKVAEPTGDGDEQIALHTVLLSEVSTWLASAAAAGKLLDLKIFAALHFARDRTSE